MTLENQNTKSELVPGWTDDDVLGLIRFGLFDSDFYVAQNPDIVGAATEPLLHFLTHGWKEGRRPSAIVSQMEMDFLANVAEIIRNPFHIFTLNHDLKSMNQN